MIMANEETIHEDLIALHQRICVCQLCDLSMGRNRAVPGEGPAPAKIMLVGEAPGMEEI
jgi:DNA polymerase